MKCQRHGPPSARSRSATVSVTTPRVNRPRIFRRLRCGAHAMTGHPQAPLGDGPSSHGPPCSLGRVQLHRPFVSPGTDSSLGWHSGAAGHAPPGVGPSRHGFPSQACPQTHPSFGRTYGVRSEPEDGEGEDIGRNWKLKMKNDRIRDPTIRVWTLDFGLWTLDFGLWTLDFRHAGPVTELPPPTKTQTPARHGRRWRRAGCRSTECG